jgi:hypothetical protein
MSVDAEQPRHDPPVLSPVQSEAVPTWRAAYSDRTSALMAAFCELAHVPFVAAPPPPPRGAPKIERGAGREKLEALLSAGDFRLVEVFNKDDAQAFLAVRDGHFAVLAFRGTETLQDWRTNLNVKRVPLPGVPPDLGNNRGFNHERIASRLWGLEVLPRPACRLSRERATGLPVLTEVSGSAIKAAQELGNPRRNRLFESLAIHLPKVIADAQSDGSGNTSVDITGTYGPFRKQIGFPQIDIPHGASPSAAPPASSLQPLPTQNRSLEKSDTIHLALPYRRGANMPVSCPCFAAHSAALARLHTSVRKKAGRTDRR